MESKNIFSNEYQKQKRMYVNLSTKTTKMNN